jgi:hypothetical protein
MQAPESRDHTSGVLCKEQYMDGNEACRGFVEALVCAAAPQIVGSRRPRCRATKLTEVIDWPRCVESCMVIFHLPVTRGDGR